MHYIMLHTIIIGTLYLEFKYKTDNAGSLDLNRPCIDTLDLEL